jgi:hypothetical protein
LLNRFFLITYADLKKYKYYYWFSFPAFVSKPAWEIGGDGWKAADGELGAEAVSKHDFVLDCTYAFGRAVAIYSWEVAIEFTAVLLGSTCWEFSGNRIYRRPRSILR